jgi:hypothetical protein
MSDLSDQLDLEDTTPVTEAVENSFDEAARSLREVSYEMQGAISAASQGHATDFVVQTSRLGLSLLRGYVSAWSSAVDGLGLIAGDEAEWWWTKQLTPVLRLPLPPAQPAVLPPLLPPGTRGVLRASVATIPQGQPISPQWVRVATGSGNAVDLIDRGVGVPLGWDGTCYVSVRQHGDFAPGAVRITFRMVNASGHTIGSTAQDPIDAVLSM